MPSASRTYIGILDGQIVAAAIARPDSADEVAAMIRRGYDVHNIEGPVSIDGPFNLTPAALTEPRPQGRGPETPDEGSTDPADRKQRLLACIRDIQPPQNSFTLDVFEACLEFYGKSTGELRHAALVGFFAALDYAQASAPEPRPSGSGPEARP